MNSIANSIKNSPTSETVKTVGIGLVCMSAVYGGFKGLCTWVSWVQKRKRIKIKYELVEPTVNISRDAGKLVWDIGLGAGASALVSATAPVSVPMLIWLGQEREHTGEEDVSG